LRRQKQELKLRRRQSAAARARENPSKRRGESVEETQQTVFQVETGEEQEDLIRRKARETVIPKSGACCRPDRVRRAKKKIEGRGRPPVLDPQNQKESRPGEKIKRKKRFKDTEKL